MKKRIILVVFLALLLSAGTLVYFGQKRVKTAELYYSGTIEATQANLAFQVSGRVEEVFVDEGQKVKKGQKLAELYDSEFLAFRNQSRAELNKAINSLKQKEAQLELTEEIVPAEVRRAEAAVKVFEAQLAELEKGYRTQEVERSLLAVQKAKTAMEEARKDKDRKDRLYGEGIISESEKDSSDLKFETAYKEFEQASKAYEIFKEGYRKESIDAARSKLEESRASLMQAKSNLKMINVIKRELNVAKSQVDAAESALGLAEIQLEYTVLKAPFDGIIMSRNVEPGEVVSPSREVLSVADLSVVDLKIFVDETEIGKVKPGQEVEIKIDTFEHKTYKGYVSFISSAAEFTPKIIQTRKERVKLVYLVKVTISNDELELKPGMPADAWIR